jgi:eukaryotic-like serine/threonine-protein kinase
MEHRIGVTMREFRPMSTPASIVRYKGTSGLGEGGMSAVYRASDTRSNRDGAVELLPPGFTEDAGRMVGFEWVMQVPASLNHPNIAAIRGVNEGGIVMELVERKDLKSPVPVETAIHCAPQITVVHLSAFRQRSQLLSLVEPYCRGNHD